MAGGQGPEPTFVKQPHRYATTLPPKKGGKTRSMQKTVFLESACTTTAANNSLHILQCHRRSRQDPSKERNDPDEGFHLNELQTVTRRHTVRIRLQNPQDHFEVRQAMKLQNESLRIKNMECRRICQKKNRFHPETQVPRQT